MLRILLSGVEGVSAVKSGEVAFVGKVVGCFGGLGVSLEEAGQGHFFEPEVLLQVDHLVNLKKSFLATEEKPDEISGNVAVRGEVVVAL